MYTISSIKMCRIIFKINKKSHKIRKFPSFESKCRMLLDILELDGAWVWANKRIETSSPLRMIKAIWPLI